VQEVDTPLVLHDEAWRAALQPLKRPMEAIIAAKQTFFMTRICT
jgi:hypothetical protein